MPTCPTGPAVPVPDHLGGFRVRGVLGWQEEDRLLLGEDPALERLVWLRLRPRSEDPLPDARKELARPTRLRWLAEGEWDEWRWDAFVAPAGERLVDLVARRGPLDWPSARPLLEQLADELRAAVADGTLPTGLALEQVHLQPTGRVLLLDGGAAAGGDADARALSLLRQVAMVALTGSVDAPARGPIRAPLPLYARALLRGLTGETAPYERVADLQADLAAARDRPAEVTTVQRALHLALCSSFLAFGLLEMLVWIRFGGVSEIMILDRAMVQTRALQWVLKDEGRREAFLGELPAGHPLRREPAATPALLEQRLALDRQEMRARVRGLGPTGSVYTMLPVLRFHREHDDGDEPLRFEPVPGDSLAVSVVRPALAKFEFGEDDPTFVGRRQLRQAADRLEAGPSGDPTRPADKLLLSGLIVLGFFPAVWVVWAFAFRGGLGLRLAGLALVRRSGKPALRLQCAWRAFLVWAPVVALLMLAVWIDVRYPSLSWLGCGLQGLFLLLIVGYAVLALRFPARGPHDRLAGTYLVPR